MDNKRGIRFSDGRAVYLPPEQVLAFLTWLHDQMPDLPEALAAWLAQQQPPTPNLPALQPSFSTDNIKLRYSPGYYAPGI
ncbi:hypothetical protein [Ktedonobacter robiniae]|uniref:hypothetical protein n=1 Tax=Ktedonobacter robiniae TaxID=2778365 RepID=UPI0019167756|nr:hypothetical protein [Ktedonobacter robiniae]